MSGLVLTPELLRSIERFGPAFQRARMGAARRAWPEWEIESREYGTVTAIRARAEFLRSKNQVLGFTKSDLPALEEIRGYFAEIGRGFQMTFPFDGMDFETFDALVRAGLRSTGSGHALVCTPEAAGSSEFTLRESPIEEKENYLDLYRRAFGTRGFGEDEERFQWVEDTLPGSHRFLAQVDDRPIAMAAMAVIRDVAYLGVCGVDPSWRGQGVHRALIQARLAKAREVGCTVALGGGSLFSPPRRNFERCGFFAVPLGMVWRWDPNDG